MKNNYKFKISLCILIHLTGFSDHKKQNMLTNQRLLLL